MVSITIIVLLIRGLLYSALILRETDGLFDAGRGKKSVDAREVWTGMLMAVPGISRPRAAAIVQMYPSAKQLLR